MQFVRERASANQIYRISEGQICSVSATNSYTIQTFWIAEFVNQYIMDRIKFSDVYLYTPDSAVEPFEWSDFLDEKNWN